MFPAAHCSICGSIGIFGPPCLIETVLPVGHKPGFQRSAHRCTALRPECIQLRLHQKRILKQHPRRTGHGSGSGLTLAQILTITLFGFPEFFGAPCSLPAQGGAVAQPLQVLAGQGAVPDELGNEHPGHMVIELVTGVVVRVFAVEHGVVSVARKALCHRKAVGLTVVVLCIGKAVPFGVAAAGLPQLGDVVQQAGMGLDVGAVDEPVIIHPARKGIRQLFADELSAVGQHGDVAGGL